MTQFVFVIWQSDDICWALFVLAWCSCTPVLSFCFVKHLWKKMQADTYIHQYRGKICKQIHVYINTGERIASSTYIHQYRGKNCKQIHIYINTGERIASKYIYIHQYRGKNCKQIHLNINTWERIEWCMKVCFTLLFFLLLNIGILFSTNGTR